MAHYNLGTNTVTFRKKKIIDYLELMPIQQGSINPNIHFIECIFTHEVSFTVSEYDRSYTFERCIFEKNVVFHGGEFKKIVQFYGGRLKEKLSILNGKFANFYFASNGNTVEIERGEFTELHFCGHDPYNRKRLTIIYLFINFNYVKAIMDIQEYFIATTRYTGLVHKETELLIRDVSFTDIQMENLFNNGKIRIFDLDTRITSEKGASLTIIRSNLAKTEFCNVDLRQVNTIVITSSFLLECSFVNVIWPDNLNISKEARGEINLLDKKETYRQLKYAYWKQGDVVAEYKFHGLEMDTYNDYLMANGEAYNWKGVENAIVLRLSKLTSNYGQSFLRPLVTLLVVGIILFTWLVALGTFSDLYITCQPNLRGMISTIPYMLEFANPVHKYELGLTGGPYVIELMMRIISAYCIYNIVRATRRFVK
ncbi:hypothetical protein GCM10022209_23760 [Chitinophaga oryziterrae]